MKLRNTPRNHLAVGKSLTLLARVWWTPGRPGAAGAPWGGSAGPGLKARAHPAAPGGQQGRPGAAPALGPTAGSRLWWKNRKSETSFPLVSFFPIYTSHTSINGEEQASSQQVCVVKKCSYFILQNGGSHRERKNLKFSKVLYSNIQKKNDQVFKECSHSSCLYWNL